MSSSDFIARDPLSCAATIISKPYWEGLAAGRLCLPRCRECERAFFYPRLWCPHCWSSNLEWLEASGFGEIYSRCRVDIPFDGRPTNEVPYVVALIDLDEGVRLPGRLRDRYDDTRVGQRVALDFGPEPSATLPVWRVLTP